MIVVFISLAVSLVIGYTYMKRQNDKQQEVVEIESNDGVVIQSAQECNSNGNCSDGNCYGKTDETSGRCKSCIPNCAETSGESSECFNSGQCCSGGICVDGHCSDGGNKCYCDSDNPCISGICYDNVCMQCAKIGMNCSSGQCCSGASCLDGSCHLCSLPGKVCSVSSDCCSGSNCLNGLCACSKNGCECMNNSSCSSGYCFGGKCKPDEKSKKISCLRIGDACESSNDCCQGSTCMASNIPATNFCESCANTDWPCSENSMCCSGLCIDGACSCNTLGCVCADDDNCASGICVNGLCSCNTVSCVCADGDTCASGVCKYGFCAN